MATVEERRNLLAGVLRLQEEGRAEDALAILEALSKVDNAPMIPILHAIMLPQVYSSLDDLQRWRTRAIQKINGLRSAGFAMDLSQSLAIPWFSLAYQGQNDREAQTALASLYRSSPQRTFDRSVRSGSNRRLRVGIVSAYFKDKHTIGKLTRGLFASLDRDQFSVTAISCGRQDDWVTRFVQDNAEQFIELPLDVAHGRRLIAGQKLDILYFTDIGMEPFSYTLAASRLAPVQCMTWGHPDTTGLPTVDYFISSEALDLPGSQDHYSEKLVRLPHLAVYYYKPVIPELNASRAAFGLPAGCHLYGIPQTLIKFHPSFDEILRQILLRDPTGLLVLLKGNRPTWHDMLLARFARSMPEVVGRVRFIDRQDYDGFLRLNFLFDVLLDPPVFGGGNTSYEAFAMGIPIVTLPSAFLRGRITYAMYQEMGLLDCVAQTPEEYVDLAVGLAGNMSFRRQVSAKILSANSVLFENTAGIRNLEAFFQAVAPTRVPHAANH